MMLTLPVFRGIVRFNEADAEDALQKNWGALSAELEFEGTDGAIVAHIREMVSRTRKMPTFELINTYFKRMEQEGDGMAVAVSTRLDTLWGTYQGTPIPLYADNHYRLLLDAFKRSVLRAETEGMLRDAAAIMASGSQRKVRENGQWVTKFVKGPEEALGFLSMALSDLQRRVRHHSPGEGDMRSEADKVREQYTRYKEDPEGSVGALSGIAQIDAWHRGLKYGELCLVLGFVGHLKTTFCLNWLYRTAVCYGKNAALISLEMPMETLTPLIYTLHTTHPRFKHELGYRHVTYEKIKAGQLTHAEERLFMKAVSDLEQNEAYGRMFYRAPEEAVTVESIQRWAENRHHEAPLDLVIIDYLGLVDPSKVTSGLEQGSRLNMVIRQAKQFAMSFAHGRGIAVLSPFQANRQGMEEASKNNGRYRLTALSTANEAERSSDVVYSIWLDDTLRQNLRARLYNLKARNSPLIAGQIEVFADPRTRLITSLDPEDMTQAPVDYDQKEASDASAGSD
jgi:hypothetical protein